MSAAPDSLHIVLPPAPSVNAIYTPRRGGGIGYTKVARQWKKLARAACAIQAYQQGWEPLDTWVRVVFKAYWPDNMRRDPTNVHKVVCDALTTVAYTDDKFALAHDEIPALDAANPRIEITCFLEPGCALKVAPSQGRTRAR